MRENESLSERATARFPAVAAARGHYESFYIKAGHPSEPVAAWIRYTVHKRPGTPPKGSLWFTLFDRREGAPLASKVTLPADRLGAGGGDYIRIGESRLAPGRATGRASSEQLDASWELEFAPGDEPFRHLPRDWMYRASLPRTKLESPHPDTRFSGRLQAGDTVVELDGWPGMVGHNWGREHAERWIWTHGANLAGGGRSAALDAAFGRIRLGPLTTPWIGNALLVLDGERHRLGGLERVRSTQVEETPHGCEFELSGPELSVQGAVRAPGKDLVGWIYADPDGSEHNTVNCSISSMRLEVRGAGAPPVVLETPFGATYELGMRERDHGVAIQPFPDG